MQVASLMLSAANCRSQFQMFQLVYTTLLANYKSQTWVKKKDKEFQHINRNWPFPKPMATHWPKNTRKINYLHTLLNHLLWKHYTAAFEIVIM